MSHQSGSRSRPRALLAGLAVLALAFLVTNVIVTPVVLFEPGVLDPDTPADRGLTILALTLNFVGFGLAGLLYLAVSGRGWAYVDLRMPTRSTLVWTAIASVGSIAFFIAFSLFAGLLDLPQTSNDIVLLVGQDRVLLYAMFAIVIFANAPAEEFLFRNVIQKRLAESFSIPGAIVLASVIFALVHVPNFLIAGMLWGALVSLFVLFCGSLIFGYAYAKTEDLLVPTVAHAVYNLVQFSILLVALEFGLVEDVEEFAEASMAVLSWLSTRVLDSVVLLDSLLVVPFC